MRVFVVFILLLLSPLVSTVFSQEKYIDEETKAVLDSLDERIVQLNEKVKKFGGNRDAKYFYTKREIDMTVFLREYEEYVFDEDLVGAQRLIESRIKTSEKRADKFAIDFYSDYKSKLTKLRGQKRAHYQKLFEKEKSFAKEYKTYIKPGTEQAYRKAHRMLDLAIKYGEDMGLDQPLIYLRKYKDNTTALMLDLKSGYDLAKLTSKEKHFQKVFNPLNQNDSLAIILKGKELVDLCYDFSYLARTDLDSNYFAMQKVVVANAIADWNERQGIASELASLTGQAIVARRDSLNKEGIYQWSDYILVIGSVVFESSSESLRKGEAIIDSDKTLYNYLRVNKILKGNKKMSMGQTYLLPVKVKDQVAYFRHDPSKQGWQYMVAYTMVLSEKKTQEIGQFLPPLQFNDSITEFELKNEGNNNE